MRISDWSSDVCPSDLAMTRARISLLPYLALNSPPRAMPMMPVASTPSVTNMAISTSTKKNVFMGSDLKRQTWGGASGFPSEDPNGAPVPGPARCRAAARSEAHTSELQSLMRISYAVFCLTNKTTKKYKQSTSTRTQQYHYSKLN